MSHKGNFNVTEMGRIALSLQELIERQDAEIVKLKEEKAGIQNQLNRALEVIEQMRGKRDRLQEMIKHNVEFMEEQAQVNSDLLSLLKKRRPRLVLFGKFKRGENNDNDD